MKQKAAPLHTFFTKRDCFTCIYFKIQPLKGIKLGILDDSYLDCAWKAVRAILNNIDEDGTVLNVSSGTGMGTNKEHYKNILIAPMAYGQSLTILALVQALENLN